MKKNVTLKNIVKVSLSNISTLISGIFVGFIIPKILSSDDYGFYKIFTLYASYANIFTFGISEGLYLKYSGTNYNDLNKNRIRFFTKLFLILQIIISVVIIIFTCVFAKNEYKFIFIALSIYLIEINLTSYYQYIAQMTLRFNDYSIRNFLKTGLTIISVIIMIALYFYNEKNFVSFKIYIGFTMFISTLLTCLYAIKYKDVSFGMSDCWLDGKKELFEIQKLGVPFLLASLCSTLILNIDKQFVSILFLPSTYGIYAFAYSMLTLVTMCTSAISTVLYPTLKAKSKDDIVTSYNTISSFIVMFVFFMMISYYPLNIIVNFFLPNYLESLIIFRIIFPGLAFTTLISVVFQNYYKLLGKNIIFLIQNVVALLLSIVGNIIAYIIFKTPEAISCASIIVLFIYYNMSEMFFRKKYKVNWIRNFIYIIVMSSGFYIITLINNIYISMIVYIIYYLIFTLIIMPHSISFIKRIFKKKENI